MEYIYGTPPPPPPPSKKTQVHDKNEGQNKRKHQGNNTNINGNKNNTASQNNQKKQKSNEPKTDYLDLPTHLPNAVPTKIINESNDICDSQQGDHIDDINDLKEEEGGNKGDFKEVVPVFGTNIVLKTEEDIQEWINQRKANWMKKISNNRPEPEPKQAPVKPERGNNREQNNRNRQNQRPQGDSNQNKGQNQRNNRNPQRKSNLNRLMIQREIQQENIAILDVIKELFDQNILTNE